MLNVDKFIFWKKKLNKRKLWLWISICAATTIIVFGTTATLWETVFKKKSSSSENNKKKFIASDTYDKHLYDDDLYPNNASSTGDIVIRLQDDDAEENKGILKNNFSFNGTAKENQDYEINWSFYSYCTIINLSIIPRRNIDSIYSKSKSLDINVKFPLYEDLDIHIDFSWYKKAINIVNGSYALKIENHIIVGLQEGYDWSDFNALLINGSDIWGIKDYALDSILPPSITNIQIEGVHSAKFKIGNFAFANNPNVEMFSWKDDSLNETTAPKIGEGIFSGCTKMKSPNCLDLPIFNYSLGGGQYIISNRNVGSVSNYIMYTYNINKNTYKIIGGLCAGYVTDNTWNRLTESVGGIKDNMGHIFDNSLIKDLEIRSFPIDKYLSSGGMTSFTNCNILETATVVLSVQTTGTVDYFKTKHFNSQYYCILHDYFSNCKALKKLTLLPDDTLPSTVTFPHSTNIDDFVTSIPLAPPSYSEFQLLAGFDFWNKIDYSNATRYALKNNIPLIFEPYALANDVSLKEISFGMDFIDDSMNTELLHNNRIMTPMYFDDFSFLNCSSFEKFSFYGYSTFMVANNFSYSESTYIAPNAFLNALAILNTIKLANWSDTIYEEPICNTNDLTYRGHTAEYNWNLITQQTQIWRNSNGKVEWQLPTTDLTRNNQPTLGSKTFYESLHWVSLPLSLLYMNYYSHIYWYYLNHSTTDYDWLKLSDIWTIFGQHYFKYKGISWIR